MGKSVYLAGPFFSTKQIQLIENVKLELLKNSTISEVYAPYDNQTINSDLDIKKGTDSWSNYIAQLDYRHVREADIVFGVLDFDGKDTDSGTAAEIGYAHALNIPTFLLQTDSSVEANLMLTFPNYYYGFFDNTEDIKNYDFNIMRQTPFTGKYI